MNMSDTSAYYELRNDVAIEVFDDEALVLQGTDCVLLNANRFLTDVLLTIDLHDPTQIANKLREVYDDSNDTVLRDTEAALEILENKRIIKRRFFYKTAGGSTKMNAEVEYIANPDVSCRIEDDSGALLYNPDTESVQVINAVGLEIWETLASPRTIHAIVNHIVDVCRDVPENSVKEDVQQFIERMTSSGFIGTVENE